MNKQKIRDWIAGGCDSWSTPHYDISRLLISHGELVEVVEAMARFDGRNNNKHLKEMAQNALREMEK